MMKPQIVKGKISRDELIMIMKENFADMVKLAVDINKEILAIGGEWHSDGDELLSKEEGYSRENVWGVNFYPRNPPEKRIDCISLINIKPGFGYRQMEIQDKEIRERIRKVIEKLLLAQNETLDIQS